MVHGFLWGRWMEVVRSMWSDGERQESGGDGIVRSGGKSKIIEDAFEDDHFTRGPWLSSDVYLHAEGVMAAGCLGDMKNYCKNRKLETIIGVIMCCTPNALGDLTVTLKDPSGTMGGIIHYKVFKE
nr:hypothetical protein [Tanacetum cinerariifolium]